jgi:predicted ATPase
MNILRCDIHDFRSIKDITIPFNKKLKIFIGHNEAGKSNIIKALSLLNVNTETTKDDIRDSYSDSEYENNAYVRFIFEFSKLEINNLFKNMLTKIFLKNEKDTETLLNFCNSDNQIIYKIDLQNNNRYYQYWTIYEKRYPSIIGQIKKIKRPNQSTVIFAGEIHALNNFEYIFIDEQIEIREELIEDANFKNIIDLYFAEKIKLAGNLHPEVIFWSYNDFQNIPQRINIASFMNNPNFCIALKNMFILSDIREIEDEIKSARNRKNGLVNLLRRVANITTEYIHSVWSEQSSIKINLNENGDNIEFAIEDEKNLYEFSRRSDGFKRFMSFLLLIGAQNKSLDIQNIFLLVDEPDIGLHPSSSRQLMNEIVNIAKNNYVYYSTHSIFMINKEDISSHYIVEKENEITKIEEITSTDIMDVEILYNALGYSAFEILQRDNIIFEGWRDKKLFTLGLKYLDDNEEIAKRAHEVGYCYSQGVKDIHRIAEILDLANRNYIIISDNDKPAQEAREKSPEKERWLTYNDFDNNIITCEDFLTIKYNNACFLNACEENSVSVKLDETIGQNNLVSQYTDILKKNKIEKSVQKKILNDYKELLYKSITRDNINESYFDFIRNVLLNNDRFTNNISP